MSRFRVLFLGTPDIAVPCLKTLIEDEHFDLVGVVTQPDRPSGRSQKIQPSPVKALALQYGINVLTPEKINTPEVLAEIQSLRAETAVVIAYGQILSASFLGLFPRNSVNIHASLLPRWRGAAPIQRSLVAGDTETGVALQVVVQKLDAGPVIGVRRISLDAEINAGDVYNQLRDLAPELLKLDYLDYLRGQISPAAQDESLVTIAAKIRKEEGLLNWKKPAQDLHGLVRGLWLWPGTWTFRDGKMLKVKKSRVVKNPNTSEPGRVLRVDTESFTVACGHDALEILEVQPESRSVMTAGAYMKGFPIPVGMQL